MSQQQNCIIYKIVKKILEIVLDIEQVFNSSFPRAIIKRVKSRNQGSGIGIYEVDAESREMNRNPGSGIRNPKSEFGIKGVELE